MFITILFLINLLFTATKQHSDAGYCETEAKTCTEAGRFTDPKLIFYDVNPPEGFNLRRDVYMRFAIMLAEARRRGKKRDWTLVLPPWYRLYHWRSLHSLAEPLPWREFFDVESFKSYIPVAEIDQVLSQISSKILEIDTLYVLKNYPDPFEGGIFVDKWEMTDDENCYYDGMFWGYKNITAKEIVCVRFQGKISMLWELISQHPSDKRVMFAHGEIPLHDTYGTKTYWDCRKSMKFNQDLIEEAEELISLYLDCNTDKCTNYVGVHFRRQDFTYIHSNDVPSITGTANQIHNFIKNNTVGINKVFIASDAELSELKKLETNLESFGYEAYHYVPSTTDIEKYKDGGIAIIDQIVCSRAASFIGTHESTFTFRIQEEREILGFHRKTTFNRLCPDTGPCDRPSVWPIVN